jgi:hypothetical protein
MNSISIRKTLLASSIALTLGAPSVYASGVNDLFGNVGFTTGAANFTMLSAGGGVVGGTNDVLMTWDGDGFNASSDYTGPGSYANVTAASTAPFFGLNWTAHDIQVFVPGSYSFDVTLGGGNDEGLGTNSGAQFLNVTVGAGQLGMHMLFDWRGNNYDFNNVDVFVVASPSSMFGAGLLYSTQTNSKGQFKCDAGFTGTIVKNCLYDGPFLGGPAPTKNQVWMMASQDGNADGVMGIPMAAGGPFAGFNANFNATMRPIADDDVCLLTDPCAVPIPAAAWLFGSGLMGLVAAAHRRKKGRGCKMS